MILDLLTSFSGLLLLSLVLAAAALICGYVRVGSTLVTMIACLLLALLFGPFRDYMLSPLEHRFPRPSQAIVADGFVVLGGAVDGANTLLHGHLISGSSAAARVTEALRLARELPQAKVVVAAGDGWIAPTAATEADLIADFLVAEGIDRSRLLLDRQSRNTYENALYAFKLAQPKPGERWLLVTNAAHMPRAIGVFRTVGWQDIRAFPVGHRTGGGVAAGHFFLPPIPIPEILEMMDTAMHEWMGLLAYRLMARTSDLFPRPDESQ